MWSGASQEFSQLIARSDANPDAYDPHRRGALGDDHRGFDRLLTRRNRTLSLSGVCFRQLSSSSALCSRTSCAASGETLRHANTVIHAPSPLGMRPPPRPEILGGTSPPKSRFFKLVFQELSKLFDFFTIFKIKWPISVEKYQHLGVGGFYEPESVPLPQLKLRFDAPTVI